MARLEQLDALIQSQRRAIAWHSSFAGLIVLAGIVIVIIVAVSGSAVTNDAAKLALGLGGGFLSSVATFPVKEVIQRRNKLGYYEGIQVQLKTSDESDRQKLEELIWDAFKKGVVE
jgi:hypothetical protein